MHQTLLGDAIATVDPHILFQALYSYPVRQGATKTKQMWRALLKHYANDINPAFQNTADYLSNRLAL